MEREMERERILSLSLSSLQFDAKHSMFAMTFLDDYKRNPASALPWISVLLFGDLVESKQLGLMRAEADEKRPRRERTYPILE